MSDAYSPRLDEALRFTAEQFRGRFRKGRPVPYLTHLLAVTALVAEGGGDEDMQIAALLHDWLEDIPGASPEELEQRFGPRVRELVVASSDCFGSPKPPWKERKDEYIAHLYGAPPEVKLICCADKLHNCSSLVIDLRLNGVRIFDSLRSGRDGAIWYYQAVYDALAYDGWNHFLLDAYRDVVVEFVRLTRDRGAGV